MSRHFFFEPRLRKFFFFLWLRVLNLVVLFEISAILMLGAVVSMRNFGGGVLRGSVSARDQVRVAKPGPVVFQVHSHICALSQGNNT